jgi:hypothetical protein
MDLTLGHSGYEFEPREPARWEYLKKIAFPINSLRSFLAYFLSPFLTSKYPVFSSKLPQ